MRLASLTLENYGPFRNLDLLLDPSPGRINLLVAPNGAGKSVLRRAFGDLLFDIPDRTPMSWLYGTQNMRISARIRDAAGDLLLVRRKGRGNTLSDGSAPVSPESVRRLLGGADRGLFDDLFALDSDLLRKGGMELCRSSGRLGALLLAGSGGLGRVQRLLAQLTEARDAIGRADRRHVSQKLWKADADAFEATNALRHAALRPEDFLAREKRAAETAGIQDALRAEHDTVAATLGRLTAVRAVRPWLRRRDDSLAVLAEAGDVPRLEPGFELRWRRALEANVAATAAATTAGRQAEDAAQALHAGGADVSLLASADTIEAVLQEAVTARNAARDLPEIETRAREAAREAARLRRDLGWDAIVPVPPAPAVRAARDRIAALAALRGAAETAATELIDAQAQLERAHAELAALPEADDPGALAALVRELRAAALPARLEAARAATRDAAAEFARALAGLPDRVGTREALAATRAPGDAVLAAHEAALTGAEAAHRDAQREHRRVLGELAAKCAALQTLRRDAALPGSGALAAARASRDALWDTIIAGGTQFVPYERALREADAIADALLRHAAEASRADTLEREIAGLREHAMAAEADCAACSAGLEVARARFTALAEAVGASGDIPAALREVLVRREAALGRALDLDRAQEQQAGAERTLAEARSRLAEALGEEGELPALLELAEGRIAEARDAASARKAAQKKYRDCERTEAERREAAGRRQSALAEWLAGWRLAVAGLARPDNEMPEVTGTALALMDELRLQEANGAGFAAREDKMHAAVDGFAARMAALCAKVAPAFAGLPPQEAAAALGALLKAQRDEAARMKTLAERHATARNDAAERAAAARAAADALAALRAALLADTDDAAELQLRRIARVAEAEATLADARRNIAAQGGGRPEDVLTALAEASTADMEAAEIARLQARQQDLVRDLEAASAEARSAAEARDRAGDGDDAVAASARREAALAALGRHAEEALVLHAAAGLLRAALDAERVATGSATVARIGAVFRALTGGAHAGIAVQDEGSVQVMVALDADGKGTKDIEKELSEGTRDQLFLALRLVALEDYVAGNPALPFVADDVLQTFDDQRAVSALHALLELSAHVQVIVFTHHPHVQALARALPAAAVHTVVIPALAEAA